MTRVIYERGCCAEEAEDKDKDNLVDQPSNSEDYLDRVSGEKFRSAGIRSFAQQRPRGSFHEVVNEFRMSTDRISDDHCS